MKTFYLVFSFSVLSLFICSCGDDIDSRPNSEKIIGKWKLESLSYSGEEEVIASANSFFYDINGVSRESTFILNFINEAEHSYNGFYVLERQRKEKDDGSFSGYLDTIFVNGFEDYVINENFYIQDNGELLSHIFRFHYINQSCRFKIENLTKELFEISFNGIHGSWNSCLLHLDYSAKFRKVQ